MDVAVAAASLWRRRSIAHRATSARALARHPRNGASVNGARCAHVQVCAAIRWRQHRVHHHQHIRSRAHIQGRSCAYAIVRFASNITKRTAARFSYFPAARFSYGALHQRHVRHVQLMPVACLVPRDRVVPLLYYNSPLAPHGARDVKVISREWRRVGFAFRGWTNAAGAYRAHAGAGAALA